VRLRRRKRAGFAESGASSDIAFLLIIYFLVIAGFNVNRGFLMELPAPDSARLVPRDEVLRFDMDAGGGLAERGEPRTWDEAARELRASASTNADLAVALSIDPAAPWQRVVSFVEIIRGLEIRFFSFTMKDTERS